MYVCICSGVTDRQIVQAARQGVSTLDGLRTTLGVAAQCGTCAQTACEILYTESELRVSPPSLPVSAPAEILPASAAV
ncbi:MAG: (2Fe-2S)-binding protein [Pseudomonadota bacterium]